MEGGQPMKSIRILSFFGLLALIIFLNGCAATHIALKPTEAKEITSVDVYIGLAQQEIYAEIVKSNVSAATGGGLLPALIDAGVDQHRAKKAEELVQPIRTALMDYDFGKCLTEKIESELKSLTWMKINNVRVSGDISKKGYEKAFVDSEASAILFMTTKYFLSHNLIVLNMSSEAKLFPKKGGKNVDLSDGNCIYKNLLFFEDSIDTRPSSKQEAINCWADNGGYITRQALDAASVGLTRMIAIDLDLSGAYVEDRKDGKETTIFRDSQVKIIRLSNGSLRSYRSR
jgi:hypothetical protein